MVPPISLLQCLHLCQLIVGRLNMTNAKKIPTMGQVVGSFKPLTMLPLVYIKISLLNLCSKPQMYQIHSLTEHRITSSRPLYPKGLLLSVQLDLAYAQPLWASFVSAPQLCV